MKTEIFANPNLELDERIKKLQRVNYKNDYKLRQHKGTVSERPLECAPAFIEMSRIPSQCK